MASKRKHIKYVEGGIGRRKGCLGQSQSEGLYHSAPTSHDPINTAPASQKGYIKRNVQGRFDGLTIRSMSERFGYQQPYTVDRHRYKMLISEVTPVEQNEEVMTQEPKDYVDPILFKLGIFASKEEYQASTDDFVARVKSGEIQPRKPEYDEEEPKGILHQK